MHASRRRALNTRLVAHIATLLGLLILSTGARADSVDELHVLVDTGNASAWDMALRMEPDNAGDPDFDFWYGLAAKAAGQKHQAVFAFERVVLSQPGNMRAKLELADAYFQFGNTAESRRLFEEVLATTPPDPVQQRIRTYLGAIEAADQRRNTHVSGYVTVAGGYDSNINSATKVVSYNLPGFPQPLVLPSSAVARDAGFMELRTGVDVVHPVDDRELNFLDLSLQERNNDPIFSGGNFDYTLLNATGGWLFQRGSASWRIPVNLQALDVMGSETRYLGTVGLEYNRALNANSSWSWFGQGGGTHFPSQEGRNTMTWLAGGAWMWSGATVPMQVTTSLYVGNDPAVHHLYRFNDRDYTGARVSLRYNLSGRQSVYAALGAQYSRYRYQTESGSYVLVFGDAGRHDVLTDASVGWQYQLRHRWSVNADVAYAGNASSGNDLYDFQRTTATLGTTWRF